MRLRYFSFYEEIRKCVAVMHTVFPFYLLYYYNSFPPVFSPGIENVPSVLPGAV